jgi:hypothetical protein
MFVISIRKPSDSVLTQDTKDSTPAVLPCLCHTADGFLFRLAMRGWQNSQRLQPHAEECCVFQWLVLEEREIILELLSHLINQSWDWERAELFTN